MWARSLKIWPRIFFLFVLIAGPARAGYWDASGNVQGNYPWSGGVHLWGGYNTYLWGDKDHDKDIWYGYFRPHARLLLAGIGNGGDLRLTFSPISFYETIFGYGSFRLNRNPDKEELQCGSFDCQARVDRIYMENTMKWKLGPLVGSLKGRWDYLIPQKGAGAFVDPAFQLKTRRNYQNVFQWGVSAGIPYDDGRWMSGGSFEQNHFKEEALNCQEWRLFTKLQTDTARQWGFTLHLNYVTYPHSEGEFGAGVRIDWKWKDELAI